MGMKKANIIYVTLLIIIFVISGCSNDIDALYPAEVDYSKSIDMNTPEGLAKTSAEINMKMLNGDITPEDGYNEMLKYCCKDSVKAMQTYKDQFIKGVKTLSEYFKDGKNPITGNQFTKTYIDENGNTSIYRIQVQKDGKKYFFRQDYILENNIWKIKGDNSINEFRILSKFLFWYI